MIPLLGHSIGPILGGFVAQNTSWRWIFWGCSAFTAISLAFGLIFLQETFAHVILRRQRIKLYGGSFPSAGSLSRLRKVAKIDLPRPLILLGTQPIIQALALYMSYLFGLNYLTISTYQTLWQNVYGEKASTASLNYISISIGFIIGSQVAGPLNDKVTSTTVPLALTAGLYWFPAFLRPQIHMRIMLLENCSD